MFTCIPVSPKESLVLGKWLVHKDAVEGVDYDLANLVKLWDVTNMEDRDLCELNQRGGEFARLYARPLFRGGRVAGPALYELLCDDGEGLHCRG